MNSKNSSMWAIVVSFYLITGQVFSISSSAQTLDSEESEVESELDGLDSEPMSKAGSDEAADEGVEDSVEEETVVAPSESIDLNENPEVIEEQAAEDDNFEEVPQPVAPKVKEVDDSFWAEAEDKPDLGYEARLHDIFVNYYNSRTSTDEWNTLVGSRMSERYLIQQGDNLWDISQTLFGDGNYWPKVWSLNSRIKNPHLISPNNSIKFLLGDESEPPAFTITENVSEKDSDPNEPSIDEGANVAIKNTNSGEDSENSQSEIPVPDLPPPLKTYRKVISKLPPSLPEWQSVGVEKTYNNLGIDYGHRKIVDIPNTIPLMSYISENDISFHGTISEIEVGHSLASSFQYIYVVMKPGEGAVGKRYLSVANRGQIQKVSSLITNKKDEMGYSIDIQGEVQLVERVEGRDEDLKGDVYRALVLNIIYPVSVGSKLIDGHIEKVTMSENGPRSQVVAQIIGGSYFNRRQVYGSESIAYLNKGQVDGLEEGQVLPIRANRKVREINTIVESNVRPIGWLRIVRVTPHFSTAVVVKAWSDILTGDLTGIGSMAQNNISVKEQSKDLGTPIESSEDFNDDFE